MRAANDFGTAASGVARGSGARFSDVSAGMAKPPEHQRGAGLRNAPSASVAGLSVQAPGQRAQVEKVLSQLSTLLDQLVRLLNGMVETRLPGGGAADSSRPTTAAGQPLRRLFPSGYADGRSAPAGQDRPGAREISNAVVASTGDKENKAGATDLFWVWGQFLDHDLDLTKSGNGAFDIPVPEGDPSFDAQGSGDRTLHFTRSQGTDNALGARQQVNDITALIDASNVYGSDPAKTAELRSFEGGRMIVSEGDYMPMGTRGFFEAGDERANENIGLTAMHTLFVREHNRVADVLAADNPGMSDEQIFTEARRWVTAQLQAVTMNEFLPVLLGPQAGGAYGGHQEGLDAQISNAFSGAAFRFGHTMVSDDLTLRDAGGNETSVALRDVFFRPDTFAAVGPDAIFRGLSSNVAQAVDPEIVDSLRSFVMEGPTSPRLDLAALNIQRGRDHGLPSLNDARAGLGMPPVTSFDDPAFREGVGARLAQVYDNPDQIDLWVGLLAEAPQGEGLVGPTQQAILADQFNRLRAGDPDWYENTFTPEQIAQLNNNRLSDIIERNTGVTDMQEYALLSPELQAATA